MGEVYRGVDVGFGGIERPVAVKLIAPALALDPGLQAAVRRRGASCRTCCVTRTSSACATSARSTAASSSPWSGSTAPTSGRILGGCATAAGQPLPLRFACLVAVEAARGLDYAHRLRDAAGQPLHLVHRDVSPSNLLVSFEGEIKVSDFGIARSRLREVDVDAGRAQGQGRLHGAGAGARRAARRARRRVLARRGAVRDADRRRTRSPTTRRSENEALERVRAGRFPPVRDAGADGAAGPRGDRAAGDGAGARASATRRCDADARGSRGVRAARVVRAVAVGLRAVRARSARGAGAGAASGRAAGDAAQAAVGHARGRGAARVQRRARRRAGVARAATTTAATIAALARRRAPAVASSAARRARRWWRKPVQLHAAIAPPPPERCAPARAGASSGRAGRPT